MPLLSVPSAAQQTDQLMQNVLAMGRHQGWGAAPSGGDDAMANGPPSCRAERGSGVTLMCPERNEAHSSVSTQQFGSSANKRLGMPFSAAAVTAVQKGASEADNNSHNTTHPPVDSPQQPWRDSKDESAFPGNADAAPAAPRNTNGVCEAIVAAARYGRLVAPSTSALATGDAAALLTSAIAASASAVAEEDERRSFSGPFGSTASDHVFHQQPHDTQQASAINAASRPTGICDGVVTVSPANAVVPFNTSETVSTTGAEMQRLLDDAHRACAAAEAHLQSDGLALREDWMGTRDLFFSAGSLFAAVGEAASAARCLLYATFINRAFHSDDEALTTLAMSVEQLKQSHPRIAADSLLRLAPCYEQRDLRYQAARCYRDAAEILENVLDEKEEAVVQYRAALDMYAETQVAAAATARSWERQRQQRCTAALWGGPTDTLSIPLPPDPSTTNGDLADATAPNSVEAASPGSVQQLVSPKSTALVPSSNNGSMEASVVGKKYNCVDFPAHGPSQYRMSTTVQRTLADACRWRLMVLLTRLGRYEEAREAALACAASVPLTLPKTKYLLYATLCVLAQGAPVERDAAVSCASDPSAVRSDAQLTSETATAISLASDADSMYFDSLYDTEKFFLKLQDEDRTFQRGKENALVRAILAANQACSLTAFDGAVRTYKEYRTTEPCVVFEVLIGQCRRSLFEHMERFA
ncbi:hypothetical protein CUR178_08173 [Leishmania enriettii]|uniref:Soluble NSF attachment protein, SNAP family protein n=1 Tax=Leishmania enriettii TaxID=5663 RepID=A0A836KU77_LEIEN|nr:hypothetical protein CUR178_08173 [Leishmania enriettii]